MKVRAALAAVVLTALSATALAQAGAGKDRQRVLDWYQQYRQAQNRLAFLLSHADSEDEKILVWVAEELGNFADEDSVAALRKLERHQQKNREGLPVAGRARWSLERIAVAPLTKQLAVHDQPIRERATVAAKLAGMDNEAAQRAALRFLCGNVNKEPSVIVPLLVRHFPHERQGRYWAAKYPTLVRAEIMSPLRSQQAHILEGAAKLAEEVRATEAADQLAHFLYADRNDPGYAGVWSQSIGTLVAFGDDAVPSVTNVLYSRNMLTQMDAIAVLRQINSDKARAALGTFRAALEKYTRKARSGELVRELDRALALPAKGGAE